MTFVSQDIAKLKRDLSKAKKFLKQAMEHLNYEDNHSEVMELKYEVEKFLKRKKK